SSCKRPALIRPRFPEVWRIYRVHLIQLMSTERFLLARQWTYQTCTEFGFFQSSDYVKQPFGKYFPVKFFTQQCIDIFGPRFDEAFIRNGINFSNNFYGGFNLKPTNVLFPNGLIDP